MSNSRPYSFRDVWLSEVCFRGERAFMELTDEAIVKEVQRGDTESFRVLVERYEPKIFRYARRFLFSGDDIKDVVQEVFVKAYVNIRGFDAARRFSPWLYRIAHNEFLNILKKKTKERRNFSIFDTDVLFPHPAVKEEMGDAVDREELKKALDQTIEKIDRRYREPLVLFYFEEMDYKEIAEVLRIPVSTVGVRLQRGRALVKKIMTG